jgi:hypothetical protein
MVGHPPKYSEIFSASTVADMRIILMKYQGPFEGKDSALT